MVQGNLKEVEDFTQALRNGKMNPHFQVGMPEGERVYSTRIRRRKVRFFICLEESKMVGGKNFLLVFREGFFIQGGVPETQSRSEGVSITRLGFDMVILRIEI